MQKISEPKPYKIPVGWPTDNRSRIVETLVGWVIHHPERESMAYKKGKWTLYSEAVGSAA